MLAILSAFSKIVKINVTCVFYFMNLLLSMTIYGLSIVALPDMLLLISSFFFFLSSSESSLNGAVELLSYVARQGEESGFGMPCLLIAAKNDLDSSSTSNRDSAKVPDVSCTIPRF